MLWDGELSMPWRWAFLCCACLVQPPTVSELKTVDTLSLLSLHICASQALGGLHSTESFSLLLKRHWLSSPRPPPALFLKAFPLPSLAVVVRYCCITNYPKAQGTKPVTMLMDSVGQVFGQVTVGMVSLCYPGGPQKVMVACQRGARITCRLVH